MAKVLEFSSQNFPRFFFRIGYFQPSVACKGVVYKKASKDLPSFMNELGVIFLENLKNVRISQKFPEREELYTTTTFDPETYLVFSPVGLVVQHVFDAVIFPHVASLLFVVRNV